MAFSPLLMQLIDALRCMPGVGRKSAQRIAFHMLERDREGASNLAASLTEAVSGIGHCSRCRMLVALYSVLCMSSAVKFHIGNRVSSIQYPVSSIQHPASSTQ